MAKLKRVAEITLILSDEEAKAIYKALGWMTGNAYNDSEMREAGAAVYKELDRVM